MAFASLIAVFVLAANQAVKTAVNIPRNLIPVVGLVIGLLIGAAAYRFTDLELSLRLWAGGLAGLSATGLFELGKNRPGNTQK
ncbi:Phage holin [compost metagenome]